MRANGRAVVLTCGVLMLVAWMPSRGADAHADYVCKSDAASVDVAPPAHGFASDAWVESGKAPWTQERMRREQQLSAYFEDENCDDAKKYGFREGQTPWLAWEYFTRYPIGYGGVPNVLLQTLLSLDPAALDEDSQLMPLARIWRQASKLEKGTFTLDHLGMGPNPGDYANGVALAPNLRGLPNGLVYDPDVVPDEVGLLPNLLAMVMPGWRSPVPDAAERSGATHWLVENVTDLERAEVELRLKFLKALPAIALIGGKISQGINKNVHSQKYDLDVATFQQPPKVDAVFFACTTCHQGRVIVGGKMDGGGRIVEPGQMHFMPGMPNTEIEAQYYSKLLMKTGFALLKSGFDETSVGLPESDTEIKPNPKAIKALLVKMLERALNDETVATIYGSSAADIDRARLQTYWVAADFPTYVADLIGTAIKTQYIYVQIAGRHAYDKTSGSRVPPELFDNRVGQMDAFGIAAGLLGIHTLRAENSFLRFLCRDNPDNPLFTLEGAAPGAACEPEQLEAAGQKIRDTVADWAPPVPAPVDIPSLSWAGNRALANWDGNQGASARTLASGTSATGDPLKVNVRIHEPLNALIDNMPPPPYPFEIDREKAKKGKQHYDDLGCAECHAPKSTEIIRVSHLGVDANRAQVTTEPARYGMAGLVMEACKIFVGNTGNTWCLPHDQDGKLIADWSIANDDYFKDTPDRVARGTAGYKPDMQYGIWARAPYLHNGSVPTLGQLICPAARPKEFLRGVLFYDEALVGFEWAVKPQQRYSAYETQSVANYDTAVWGRSNTGHTFGSTLCPDLTGPDGTPLDPVAGREEITRRIVASQAGELIEYMKTF